MNFKVNVTLIAVSLAALIGLFVHFQKQHYENKLIEQEQEHQQVLNAMREEAEKAQLELEKRIKKADEVYYKELKQNEKIISNLRNDVRNGAIRLRNNTTSRASADGNQSAPVGQTETAQCGAGETGIEQHILTIADYALTAIAQRDACVDMVGGVLTE